MRKQEKTESALSSLRSVQSKLMAIDTDELDPVGKNKLAADLKTCATTILKLEKTDLSDLGNDFKKLETKLIKASSELEKNKKGLDDATQLVNSATKVIGITTEIASLLA